MLILMFGTGIILTVVTHGILFLHPLRSSKEIAKLLRKKDKAGEGGITPFQAVATALAGTLGTGNIIGVALAISIGGPGSIFWMWTAALFGMVIKYCEAALAVRYRQTVDGCNAGGPMYYMKNGLNAKKMSVWFCTAAVISSFGIGSSVQSNSIAKSAEIAFGADEGFTAVVISAASALVLIGGIKRIAGMAQVLVPVMAGMYIMAALFVLAANIGSIPQAFGMIFHDAFTGSAAAGGFAGATAMQACRLGLSRGVFTNEAGLGSAPIAHAAGDVEHPAQQGLLGAFEVFADTIVTCTLTALVVIVTGAWKENGGITGTASAFDSVLPFGTGSYIVYLGLILFAFATIPAWYYYGEKCVQYLSGGRWLMCYKIAYVAAVYAGAVVTFDRVWILADFFNGMMAVPNLLALIMLAPEAGRITKDFFS